jgi:hypothetical protein
MKEHSHTFTMQLLVVAMGLNWEKVAESGTDDQLDRAKHQGRASHPQSPIAQAIYDIHFM